MSTTKTAQKLHGKKHNGQLACNNLSEGFNLDLTPIVEEMLELVKTSSRNKTNEETDKHLNRISASIARMAHQISE